MTTDPTLREIASRWLESVRHQVRPGTLDQYRRVQARLCEHLGQMRMSEVTPMVALRYGQERLAGGVGAATANRDWRILRQITAWAGDTGLTPDPLQQARRPPARVGAPRNPARPMTAEEWERFAEAVREDDRGPRMVPQYPLFLALSETGARMGELLALEWSSVDLEAEVLVVRAETCKTRRERIVPLSPVLQGELARLRDLHGHLRAADVALAERVFLSPTGREANPGHTRAYFDTMLERAGIPKRDERGRRVSPHCLRHTLASRLASAGVSVELAAQMLGHVTPRITEEVYTHRKVEDLRAVLQQRAWGTPAAPEGVGDVLQARYLEALARHQDAKAAPPPASDDKALALELAKASQAIARVAELLALRCNPGAADE